MVFCNAARASRFKQGLQIRDVLRLMQQVRSGWSGTRQILRKSQFSTHIVNCIYTYSMVLRRIFGPRKDEVTGEWRRLHNQELNDLYSSPNIVRVIKSRRMRWTGHVACMGEERVCIGSWWETGGKVTTGET